MASNSPFILKADYRPTGDQPEAIDALCGGLDAGRRYQTLEGVTGSGKTFTMANVIRHWGRPALVLSHNKTLAAQLYAELKGFFPDNAVEYFVSYYDYYQPEAYIPTTDTFIEKDASINEAIERLRLAATDALLNRGDAIIVASVSCIYGLGSPEDYREMTVRLERGEAAGRDAILDRLVSIRYTRNDVAPQPGAFRVRGDTVDVYPSHGGSLVRVSFFGDTVESLRRVDPATGRAAGEMNVVTLSPARHFVMPEGKIASALDAIRAEMEDRVRWFLARDKLIEAQRIRMRATFDIEMMKELGYCSGIENYSRHLAGRAPGERPACLIDYFQGDFLTIIDESHVTLPQIRGMFNGDRARKTTLVEHGFRLPSALDNRPLNFEEFLDVTGPILFASATPGEFERAVGGPPAIQVIRPTGIVDPPVEVRPLDGQIDDVMEEIRAAADKAERVLVTTLTKRTAEDLAEYLKTAGLRVKHLHSDIDAIERVDILRGLRKADFDCLIGINLLREGLDLPEVSLVAILDADKEGFLRSETSLIQTAGRAARHTGGRVILYADKVTDSMRRMIELTARRRARQMEYNRDRGIAPQAIRKGIQQSLAIRDEAEKVEASVVRESGVDYDLFQTLQAIEREMLEAADALEFERAAALRDRLRELRGETPAPRDPTRPELRYPRPAAARKRNAVRSRR